MSEPIIIPVGFTPAPKRELDPLKTITAMEIAKAQIARQTIRETMLGLNKLVPQVQGTYYALEMARTDLHNAQFELLKAYDKLMMLPEEHED
jgi:hypothetical protein